jgi:hypothetical protein
MLARVALVFLAAMSAHAGDLDTEIKDMLQQVDANRLLATVERLEAFGTRHSCSTGAPAGRGVSAARDWILARFLEIPGLQVRLDPFTHAGCPNAPTFNVIAWLPGTMHPEQLILIGGHYDSRTTDNNDAVSDAPGANDSGSQTALVLEAARVLAKSSFDATFVFVAFSGEEQGLSGSSELAGNLTSYFDLDSPNVVAMFNSDIVGGDASVNGPADLDQFRLYSPGTPREIGNADGTTDNTSPSRGLMRYVGTWGLAYVPALKMVPKLREDRPGRGGDQTSFVRQQRPAVRFIEAWECSPSPPDHSTPFPPPRFPANCLSFASSHQHSPNDLSRFITPAYMARVAQVVVATSGHLARAPSAPLSISAAGSATSTVTVRWEAPSTGPVDHFVVGARSTAENLYRKRVEVPGDETSRSFTPAELGLAAGESFFISVAAADEQGHESLFAYPEFRCDPSECIVPPGSLDVVAPE